MIIFKPFFSLLAVFWVAAGTVLTLILIHPLPTYADLSNENRSPGPVLNLGSNRRINAVITSTSQITDGLSPMNISPPVLSTPANGAAIETARPAFNWSNVTGAVSYTLRITGEQAFTGLGGQAVTVDITTTASIYTPTQNLPTGVYTWTVQAHNAAGEFSGYASPFTFTLQIAWQQIFLPVIHKSPEPVCPLVSGAVFEIIPIDGDRTDRPDYLHADLNLSRRGYNVIGESKTLQDYNGAADPDAPQLAGLFAPNAFPGISSVHQVNQWDWLCGVTHGCPGPLITNPAVTLMGLPTTSGQKIYIPERTAQIYGGGYKVMVLYAEEQQITLGYTRHDTIASGYSVHIENVCVDPNLLALYQAQIDAGGRRIFKNGSYWLPALRNDQALGTALGGEVLVAIRDRGAFMDPRSRKDWWKNY